MNLLDQSGVTGGGLDPYYVPALFVKHGQHVDGKIWKLRLSCCQWLLRKSPGNVYDKL